MHDVEYFSSSFQQHKLLHPRVALEQKHQKLEACVIRSCTTKGNDKNAIVYI